MGELSNFSFPFGFDCILAIKNYKNIITVDINLIYK